MKLTTFSSDGPSEIGIVTGQGLVPINQIDSSLPKNMTELIDQLEGLKTKIENIVKGFQLVFKGLQNTKLGTFRFLLP
ncbi:hypothetical protein OAK75_08115 [Bacteriovoracales bacterium]|nr:hypothetical protein [Bacteriovoracales bacterium]